LKCFWQYLCDNCDQSGVWEPDFETASYFIGHSMDIGKALIAFQDRVETTRSGKWRILKFVKFQYGSLNIDCKPHKPVFDCIQRHGLDVDTVVNGSRSLSVNGNPIETLSLPFQRVQEKDKEKEKEQDTEKRKTFVQPTPNEVEAYSAEIGYPLPGQAWCDSYAQKGWRVGKNPMKDWKAAVRTWKANEYRINGNSNTEQLPLNARYTIAQ
jgi:hypothetical protein